MSLRNSNATTKIPKFLRDNLNNKRINKIYKKFEISLNLDESFAVAVSGGPDSLALAFLSKIYSIRRNVISKFLIIDHKLRKDSSLEEKKVKNILNKVNIKANILKWNGKKPLKNIQSEARKKRYDLLFKKCKELKINNIVLGHHFDDLIENFFIRMTRGSGLKGLVSFEKKNEIQKINLLRPLLSFKKKDLIFISNYVLNFYVKDPSNKDLKYTRIRIRELINKLEKNGFDKNKFNLTINNLKRSNDALLYYVESNKKINSFFNKKKKTLILNEEFFNQPYEVSFRSLSDSIKLIGGKYYSARGKKIDFILKRIIGNSFKMGTLGGCIIKKLNQSVILSKEY